MSLTTLISVEDEYIDEFFVKLNEVDNVTKNIIREIIRECGIRKNRLSENFVTYYVKLASLDPKWGLSPEHSMSREEVGLFVNESVKKLCEPQSLPIICLKMQAYFNMACIPRSQLIRNVREGYENRLLPIENDLKFSQNVKDDVKETYIYSKIAFYITLKAGLGNPMDEAIQKEAFLALHSIFPKSEVRWFTKLGLKEKKEYLDELTALVAGIRLFNRDCGTGGVGIEDVPKQLKESIEVMIQQLNTKLKEIMENVFLLTTILEFTHSDGDSDLHIVTDTEKKDMKKIDLSDNENSDDNSNNYIEYIKHCLIIYRQYEVYMRRFILDAEKVEKHTIQLIGIFQKTLMKLHETVKFRTAIPTSQVFPMFLRIADAWFLLLDEVIVLHNVKTIYSELNILTNGMRFNRESISKLLHGQKVITDADRLLLSEDKQQIKKINNSCVIVYPNDLQTRDKIPIQFLGFCPVQLVELKGALFPGNPKIGSVVWQNMYFVFSTIERAIIFQKHPDMIYKKCLELARNNLELIFLLQLYDQLSSYKNIGRLFVKPIPVIICYDAGVQTEVHPQDEAIVPDYKWNIWDLKREAILFSNLKNRLTKSIQTYKSNYRAPVAIQAYLPKDQYTQSMKDVYTNVPTLQNYIFGLRGRKTNDQHVIELTRPVHE